MQPVTTAKPGGGVVELTQIIIAVVGIVSLCAITCGTSLYVLLVRLWPEFGSRNEIRRSETRIDAAPRATREPVDQPIILTEDLRLAEASGRTIKMRPAVPVFGTP